MKKKQLTAIDLYSGVGGWSLGLHLAGIKVVSSYEWWAPANLTNEVNNNHPTHLVDVRRVADEALAKQKVDIVVGSPPCTQFSFSNRGGGGDIADGFLDLAAFFEIVSQCEPTWWAMENVPRVAELLPEAIKRGRPLYKYRELIERATISVVNCADYGVPQARKRCIVGNFDFELLYAYKKDMPTRTLGSILPALSKKSVVDPIYGIKLQQTELTDHEKEQSLTKEEERLNREAKTYHPVYNAMSFPEKNSHPARTVTATCTRVSRESLIVKDEDQHGYRRLTIRERASLQSFPINYQFMGSSASEKMKMVGNAIPPLFTFLIGQAILGNKKPDLVKLKEAVGINPTNRKAPVTTTDMSTGRYRPERNFRLALPHLRFKSGTRFELSNSELFSSGAWLVTFYFGNSKDIRTVTPNQSIFKKLLGELSETQVKTLEAARAAAADIRANIDPTELQEVWTNRKFGTHPFEVVDDLGNAATIAIANLLKLSNSKTGGERLLASLSKIIGEDGGLSQKLSANAAEIAAGLAIAAGFNQKSKGRLTKH